jgi:hypothetical protein
LSLLYPDLESHLYKVCFQWPEQHLKKIKIRPHHSLFKSFQCFSTAIRLKLRPLAPVYLALQDYDPCSSLTSCPSVASSASLSVCYTELSKSEICPVPFHLRAFALTVPTAWNEPLSELCLLSSVQPPLLFPLHTIPSLRFPSSYFPLSKITLFTCLFFIGSLFPLQ